MCFVCKVFALIPSPTPRSPQLSWDFLRWTLTHNQSILREISPGCSLEGMMLKLKLQYFGHLMWRVVSLEKTHAGRDWGQEEKGTTEDEMAGWHHWLDGREFEWAPGVGDGQGGLACWDSWGCKELDTTERLNWHIKGEEPLGWQSKAVGSNLSSASNWFCDLQQMTSPLHTLVFSSVKWESWTREIYSSRLTNLGNTHKTRRIRLEDILPCPLA